jgi:plastocyanin
MRLSSRLVPLLVLATAVACASAGRSSHGAGVIRVAIKGFAFDPKNAEISLGDTVEWVNNDDFTHSAVSDGGSFDTGDIPAEERRTFVPRSKGTFAYHCSWHPTMRATIVVK